MSSTSSDAPVQLRAPTWTFFTNHTHVLVCLRENPRQPLREVADKIGITERAVQKIVADLEQGGVLIRRREGRSNVYELVLDQPLRHHLEQHCTIGEVLDLIVQGPANSDI